MSVLNQSGEEQVECPLCMEPLEVDDLHFYPCTCGYQICRFCWNRIREGENGLCPACRKAYPENPADFTPLSQEQVAAIKTEKKAREQKRRNKTLESRRALANVRVVQNNLVFVVGLPVRLADPEILKRQEYFGKYGKIHKVVINQSTTYAGSQGPSASAYVTYVSPADALRAIQGVNNVTLDGRVLKGSLGTTKYCANFMKNQPCPKPDCMYLHELGDPKASFTKEEMHAGLHQVYERKLHNQLLASQRDSNNSSGNSSTNAEKGSSKDGNPSNFIPTTVVTSSHINVVNSSKSKKESVNGSSGGGSGSGSSSSSGSGKDAWPSLGSSPPAASPARKHSPKPDDGKDWPSLGCEPPSEPHRKHSPKPSTGAEVKSQENGTSESSSPTLTQQPPAKSKDDKPSRKESTNGQTSKKNKADKSKQTKSNSINNDETDEKTFNTQTHSVFENDTQQYLSNELDELESDRHSLLENHDLLDNSDHSLLEDDNTHNLLNDANNEVMMMQRHREMLAGLVDSNHLMPHVKSPLVNGYGLLDRDMGYDRQINQISQGMDQKELLLRERSRSEMLMRQNELLARQHMVDPKLYMPTSSIGLESTSELLGANFHPNPSMLPPFGMRVDNSMGNSSMTSNSIASNLGGSSMSTGSLASNMGGFMMHNQHVMNQQPLQGGLVNGFDNPQNNSEGRYLEGNMDKFFTDFHKAQQMRLLLARGHSPDPRYNLHNMLSAERLEMDHKQRMNNMRTDGIGHRAAGDGDDDLDFDPFKETQKALAEMMETEMMQTTVSSGDNMERVRRARLPPPGFGPVSTFAPPPRHHHHQGFSSNSGYSDWTQMDPAIMSTSVNFNKPAAGSSLSPHQQELFARFNHLSVQPNGVNKIQVPLVQQWANAGKLGWSYNSIPLPPGFAPAKPGQHAAECIDAK
ncbi:uncharacterized protein LOC126377834 isoform X2 [Pectinophora gossypiella]|nr:uncharacterized protein LOC126377834 isoform X2 [Pectinophora gossypiella]